MTWEVKEMLTIVVVTNISLTGWRECHHAIKIHRRALLTLPYSSRVEARSTENQRAPEKPVACTFAQERQQSPERFVLRGTLGASRR